jgi:hypothetical protein
VGRKAKNSAIDVLCREWGRTRRQILGVDDPKLAKEYIGALRSTLAERRDLHSGSKSNVVDQHWPEVYTGEARWVNEAFHSMRPWLRVVMDLHFCSSAAPTIKADFLAISVQSYWREVNDVRTFVEGYLASKDAAA